jgi:predicted permease
MIWKRFRGRLRYWLNGGERQSLLREEMEFHIAEMVDELVAQGMSKPEAHAAAHRKFGNMTQKSEEARSTWIARWTSDLAQDLRHSFRGMPREAGFTAFTILIAGLGIGATTAIYSLVDQVILHALPVRDPGRLVLVDWKGEQLASGFGSYNLMSYPICRDLQQQTRFFEGVLCRAETTVNLSAAGDPKPVGAEIVSGTYFSVLGVGPALGRVIENQDDAAPLAGPVIVLAYDFWQSNFGGATDVLGRKVLVNQYPMTIVGVAAPGFRGIDVGVVPAFWMPASVSEQVIPDFHDLLDRRTRWMQILGRLRPGLTAARAQAGLQPWFKAMLEEDTHRAGFPKVTAGDRRLFLASNLQLTPAPQGHSALRRSLTRPLWFLFAATGVLLGLACLNVAGLFLARGSAREREIGTRLALGASRGRIARQLLADGLLLSFAGGALGIALGPPAIRALISFLPRQVASNALDASLSPRLVVFAFLVSVVSGVLSSLAPALHAGRHNLISSLRERGGTGFGGIRLRKCIVTLQVAFSLILLVGAVLSMRSLSSLLAKGPGFDTTSLVSFSLDPEMNAYSQDQARQLIRRIHAELRAAPITRNSAVARVLLLTGGSWNNRVTIQADRRFTTERQVEMNAVSPGFFATMRIPLLAGRRFDEHDSRPIGETGRRSVIVNQAFVNRYLAGRSPLGVRIGIGTFPETKTDIEIVGVVGDISYRGLREQSEEAWFPIFAGDDATGAFYVRVRGTPEQAFQTIRQIVHQADPQLPILAFRTVNEQVGRSLSTERLLAALSGTFGALALLLSLIGLYGVMSFVVTRRTREIGIRLALGATGASAIGLVLRDAVAMIAGGIAIALPCVAALGQLVQSQLFGVTATDPAAVAAAAAVLAAGALAAAFIPAWRASNVNPTEALRLD